FVSEVVNYIAVLPVVLATPGRAPHEWLQRVRGLRPTLRTVTPLLAFVACIVLAVALRTGVGALAFPIPALLWCAVTYSLFSTTLLTLTLVMWMLFALSTGFIGLEANGAYPGMTLHDMT